MRNWRQCNFGGGVWNVHVVGFDNVYGLWCLLVLMSEVKGALKCTDFLEIKKKKPEQAFWTFVPRRPLSVSGAEHGISSDGFFELEDLPKWVNISLALRSVSLLLCKLDNGPNLSTHFCNSPTKNKSICTIFQENCRGWRWIHCCGTGRNPENFGLGHFLVDQIWPGDGCYWKRLHQREKLLFSCVLYPWLFGSRFCGHLTIWYLRVSQKK